MVRVVFSMSKITTKRGDSGLTDLYGALRVPKHHYLIQIIGSLDELQSVIGLLKVKLKKKQLLAELDRVQEYLYQLMAYLANSQAHKLPNLKDMLISVEFQVRNWGNNSQIGRSFVIPGQNEQESLAHLCRAKTRNTERLLSQYATKSVKIKSLLPLLNRLSDYFFVLSQYLLKT